MSAGPNLGMALSPSADGFDPTFYAQNNPDVAQSGMDPAAHYQAFGMKEGRAGNAAEAANGAWTYNGRVASYGLQPGEDPAKATAKTADAKGAADFSNNPYGFDAAYYLKTNPSVAAAGVDPLQNFLQYGINNGANRNAYVAANGGENSNIAAGVMAPPPATTAALNPNDPSSWAGWNTAAHAATQGLNRMPNVAPPTASLSADPLAVRAQFYPKGNNPVYQTLGYGGTPDPMAGVAGAGTLQVTPEMQATLRNLGMKL